MNKCINEREYQPECPCEHCSSIFLEIKEYLSHRMSLTDSLSPSYSTLGVQEDILARRSYYWVWPIYNHRHFSVLFTKYHLFQMKPGYGEYTLGFYTHLLTHFFTESFENYWAFVRTVEHN